MNTLNAAALSLCLVLGATSAFAADDMAKDGMAKDSMQHDTMSKDAMSKDGGCPGRC